MANRPKRRQQLAPGILADDLSQSAHYEKRSEMKPDPAATAPAAP